MSRIRSKNTRPEMLVRRLVHRMGYRYRLHRRQLPGVPDLVFAYRRKIVFVNGCFWHRHKNCRRASTPATRRAYWQQKFKRNKARDQSNLRKLRRLRWKILVIWECQLKDHDRLERKLVAFLEASAKPEPVVIGCRAADATRSRSPRLGGRLPRRTSREVRSQS